MSHTTERFRNAFQKLPGNVQKAARRKEFTAEDAETAEQKDGRTSISEPAAVVTPPRPGWLLVDPT